ncbi:CRISPR-associated endonuclease Cas2 [Alloscardovia macacae]|uniref:CRISPR-associated endoribonuclease Cas2 n=1 Tax=Alloscardovia macacae TaxID=1160091 RepID=A0A1Y2SVC7_9BIFI|nr:CRISPR-associated endonuclease Cas2 [Alloscardovia macacae]OTA26126.1 CRISPR-associated endonuclease Cas2 [Alloscardovia macacae]OZG55086.1 CRISPR-associated endonuclease Cas2 [Alloscardovia macacae]
MRVIVFFDLPTKTDAERKIYRLFRRSLLKEGFLMIQESVYVRIATNHESARFIENRVGSLSPDVGTVQSLIVTEKQYASMKFLSGEPSGDIRNLDTGTVVI